jgi:hypothetical protein
VETIAGMPDLGNAPDGPTSKTNINPGGQFEIHPKTFELYLIDNGIRIRFITPEIPSLKFLCAAVVTDKLEEEANEIPPHSHPLINQTPSIPQQATTSKLTQGLTEGFTYHQKIHQLNNYPDDIKQFLGISSNQKLQREILHKYKNQTRKLASRKRTEASSFARQPF